MKPLKPISRWRTCLLRNRKTKLPDRSGLYAVLDRSGNILYIGKAVNLRRRWASGHHRYKQASRVRYAKLAFTLVPESKISELELELITKHKPVWNGTKVPRPMSFSITQVCIATAIALFIGFMFGSATNVSEYSAYSESID